MKLIYVHFYIVSEMLSSSALLIVHAEASQYSNIETLYRNITHNYVKEVLPLENNKNKFTLDFNFIPISLNSFIETEETLSFTLAVQLIWHDKRLSWDLLKYKDIHHITISTGDIWIPFVFLINSADALEPVGHGSEFYAFIHSSGVVSWTPGDILKTKCPANTFRFPFDTQQCVLQFLLWGVPDFDSQYTINSKLVNMEFFTNNSDWIVTSIRQYPTMLSKAVKCVELEIFIKRNSLYNIIVVLLPTVLFCFMNPLVFVLPVESGERVSYAMTVLLAYAIFLTIVTGTLPASSNPMCLLLLLMIFVMLVSGLIVFSVIVTVYYNQIYDISKISKCLVKLSRCMKKDGIDTDGKGISNYLDKVFLTISYLLFFGSIAVYFALVY